MATGKENTAELIIGVYSLIPERPQWTSRFGEVRAGVRTLSKGYPFCVEVDNALYYPDNPASLAEAKDRMRERGLEWIADHHLSEGVRERVVEFSIVAPPVRLLSGQEFEDLYTKGIPPRTIKR